MYPPCTSNRRKERFERFCRLLESITCGLSVMPSGSSPAWLTIDPNMVRAQPPEKKIVRPSIPFPGEGQAICRPQERRAKNPRSIPDHGAADLNTFFLFIGRCQNE
jgi:hypothetical protein